MPAAAWTTMSALSVSQNTALGWDVFSDTRGCRFDSAGYEYQPIRKVCERLDLTAKSQKPASPPGQISVPISRSRNFQRADAQSRTGATDPGRQECDPADDEQQDGEVVRPSRLVPWDVAIDGLDELLRLTEPRDNGGHIGRVGVIGIEGHGDPVAGASDHPFAASARQPPRCPADADQVVRE
jgi:hypothetical protein